MFPRIFLCCFVSVLVRTKNLPGKVLNGFIFENHCYNMRTYFQFSIFICSIIEYETEKEFSNSFDFLLFSIFSLDFHKLRRRYIIVCLRKKLFISFYYNKSWIEIQIEFKFVLNEMCIMMPKRHDTCTNVSIPIFIVFTFQVYLYSYIAKTQKKTKNLYNEEKPRNSNKNEIRTRL